MIERQMGVRKTRYLGVIVAFVASVCVLSCGGSREQPPKTAGKSRASAIKRTKADKQPVSEAGKRWGGWRWRGKRDTCFFVFRNHCFSSKKRACSVAKCGARKCKHRGGGPAEIYCEK